MDAKADAPLPFKQEMGLVMGLKVLRILIMYFSLSIATNYMSQIYMEKVLVNNENPPPLTNYVYLFFAIDAFLNVFLLLAVKLLINFGVLHSSVLVSYLKDYLMCSGILFTLSWLTTRVVQSKKYFLYKDDGLRAIRANESIVFNFGFIIHLLPMSLMTEGLIGMIAQKMGDKSKE